MVSGMTRGFIVAAPRETKEQRKRISKGAVSFEEPLFEVFGDTGDDDVLCEAPEAEPVLDSVTGWMKFVGKGEKGVVARITAWVTEAEAVLGPGDFD